MKKKLLWGFVLFGLWGMAHARWRLPYEADLEYVYSQEIDVAEDGGSTCLLEEDYKVLTEEGRESTNTLSIHYGAESQKVEVLEAWTVYQGEKYPVRKEMIEDKALSSSLYGFEDIHRVIVAFPKVEVGSKVHIKYRITKQSILEDFFGGLFHLGWSGLLPQGKIRINSSLPLNFIVNDPEQALKISEEKTEGKHHLTIELIKPLYYSITNEPSAGVVNRKTMTWVSVSSLSDWEEFAVKRSKGWEAVVTQDLPRDFQQILELAKEELSETAQINKVIALLNDKVVYMGDWRTVKGQYIPRSLAEIADTQYGDCKDFSAVTGAILHRLGFKVQFVAVNRGIKNLSLDTLPGFPGFNHAILRVGGKQGKIYWVDPTNFVAMSENIFPDIADKKCLVLDAQEPLYLKSSAIDYQETRREVERVWELKDKGRILETGAYFCSGVEAIQPCEYIMRYPPEEVKEGLFYALASHQRLRKEDLVFMELPKLEGREVKELRIPYSFVREGDFMSTNGGKALKIPCSELVYKIRGITPDLVTDIFINDFPLTYRQTITIKNIRAKGVSKLNKEMDTPWVRIKRTYHQDKTDLRIEDVIIVYKNLITNQEIKSEKFIELRDWLSNNFEDILLYTDR